MTDIFMDHYITIGKIAKIVSNNSELDIIFKQAIAAILESIKSDYVVVWFFDGEELKPYYWIGNKDFTSKSCKNNEGIVGKVFSNQKSIRALNKDDVSALANDELISSEISELNIKSLICVPFSSKHENVGCIQFIRTNDNDSYTEEQADIFEIYANFLAIQIDENANISNNNRFHNVLLTARNIQKTFKNGENYSTVLKGVNIDVFEGEFLVILGESGCGKSTFLNIIGGMETCDGGEFIYLGKDMTSATPSELTEYRRHNIGFIFQSYNLMPNLTALDNLNLIAELVDDPMDSKEALKQVGLEKQMNSYPAQLSGGQQQRISIARAIVKKPKLIFADEPTAALDYATSIEVLSVLENIVKTGTTLVMVTHNEEITKMADRVIRMRNGKSYETVINKHPLSAKELVW